MPTRRQILAGAAAVAGAAAIASRTPANAAAVDEIIARTGTARLLGQGAPATPIWGYNGSVPGPTLRARQGQPFAIDLVNNLQQPTTVHWHGIRIANAMDGVAGLTQPPIAPGGRFAYRFIPPDAGTYWYHPHNRTWEQLARGLQGAFIVEEDKPQPFDRDLVLVFDDWRLDQDGRIHERSFASMHDISHAGRLGNVLTLNAQDTMDLPVKAGERLRIRLINTANARIMGITFEAHAPIVVALDGQPLETPFAPQRNTVVLAPAQRADIVLDCTDEPGATTAIVVETGREKLRLGRLVYAPARRARARPLPDIPILPPNPMPVDLDLETMSTLDLEMTGGAMAVFESAFYRGRQMGVRELVRQHRKVWAFNGIVGMPDNPLIQVARGTTLAIKMINRTAWPHAMHFHGHHVRETDHSQRAPLPYWRDTVLVQRGETVTVAFKAHNPGKWMLHCHMLSHQAGGMSTWYEVS
jgi:FtsP/CotA-like multicopper oxidase with cupredoxin domain